MSLTNVKSQVGSALLALALGLALAWAVVVGSPTGQQSSATVAAPNSVIVADGGGTNPPPCHC